MSREPSFPLEPTGPELRRWIEQTTDRLVDFLDRLADSPADGTEGGAELAKSLAEALPDRGEPFEDLLSLLFDRAVPCTYKTAHPGYLAYIPGGGLPHSGIAALIANIVNSYITVWVASPALVQLESNVVRWFCDLMGFPEEAGGYLSSGGSMANFTAVVTARCELLPENFLNGTLYASDQVHHSVLKAAKLAGFPLSRVRPIPSDAAFRISPPVLEAQIARDRAAGRQPFLIVGNAGSTNTGAVDDLRALADLAAKHEMWFHVDAAYGGFFQATERGRLELSGIERADSVTLDPHKGLFLPYGTGCLIVRDKETLRRTHSTQADYMPALQQDAGFDDFCELSPELSRDIRGLRVWLPIKMAGFDAFRRQLDEKLDLAHHAAERLATLPDVEVLAEPQLSLVVFRWAPAELSPAETNELNEKLLAAINRRRRILMTSTRVFDDVFVLRICVLSFRTHRDRVDMALEDIRAGISEISRRRPSG